MYARAFIVGPSTAQHRKLLASMVVLLVFREPSLLVWGTMASIPCLGVGSRIPCLHSEPCCQSLNPKALTQSCRPSLARCASAHPSCFRLRLARHDLRTRPIVRGSRAMRLVPGPWPAYRVWLQVHRDDVGHRQVIGGPRPSFSIPDSPTMLQKCGVHGWPQHCPPQHWPHNVPTVGRNAPLTPQVHAFLAPQVLA